MGDGSAWGGRLPCKQEFRSVRFRYPPPIELKGVKTVLESKHYYIDLINSTKAYKFTSYYHYSGVGFKKAKIN